MTILVDHMPFSDNPSEVTIQSQRVQLKANQIIVWVSLSHERLKTTDPLAIPFPAILDTGHNHTFSIHERHLIEWGGLHPFNLNPLTAIRDRGQRLLLRAANVWVYRNEKGSRDKLTDSSPHLIDAERGIAVYPGSDFPRLPIFGLRAIAENNLVLKVDGPRREATLRTPIQWWPF
jgi:hypothetical protein